MSQQLVFVILAVLVAASLAAPGERVRRHYEGALGGGYGGGGGGGGGGTLGGYGHGGHGFGVPHYPGGASQSFSKSTASASSSSVGGAVGKR